MKLSLMPCLVLYLLHHFNKDDMFLWHPSAQLKDRDVTKSIKLDGFGEDKVILQLDIHYNV